MISTRTGPPGPRYTEAEALLKTELARWRTPENGDNNALEENVNRLARVYADQNKLLEAEQILAPLVTDSLVAQALQDGIPGLKKHPALGGRLNLLVEVYGKEGKSAQADALFTKVNKLMAGSSAAGLSNEGLAASVNSAVLMASTYIRSNRDADAKEVILRALEQFQLLMGQKDAATQRARVGLLSLCMLYIDMGKHAPAQQLYRDILEVHLNTLSDEDIARSSIGSGPWAEMYTRYGARDSFEKTEELLDKIYRIQRRVLGESGPFRAALWSLTQVYWDHAKFEIVNGRPRDGQRLYEKADELITELVKVIRAPAGGADQVRAFLNVSRQAQIRASLGRFEDAETQFNQVLQFRRGNPNEVRNLPFVMASLGWVRIYQHKYVEAESVLREACGLFTPDDPQRASCNSVLGASLVGQKRFAEAEPLLLSGYDGLIHETRDDRPTTSAGNRLVTSRFFPQDAVAWIVRLYEESGRPDQATNWRIKLRTSAPSINPPF